MREKYIAKLDTQNKAVLALKAEGDKRVGEATKGLQAAQEAAGRAQAEATRLRTAAAAASSQRGPSKGCEPSGADRAVSELRKGLL